MNNPSGTSAASTSTASATAPTTAPSRFVPRREGNAELTGTGGSLFGPSPISNVALVGGSGSGNTSAVGTRIGPPLVDQRYRPPPMPQHPKSVQQQKQQQQPQQHQQQQQQPQHHVLPHQPLQSQQQQKPLNEPPFSLQMDYQRATQAGKPGPQLSFLANPMGGHRGPEPASTWGQPMGRRDDSGYMMFSPMQSQQLESMPPSAAAMSYPRPGVSAPPEQRYLPSAGSSVPSRSSDPYGHGGIMSRGASHPPYNAALFADSHSQQRPMFSNVSHMRYHGPGNFAYQHHEFVKECNRIAVQETGQVPEYFSESLLYRVAESLGIPADRVLLSFCILTSQAVVDYAMDFSDRFPSVTISDLSFLSDMRASGLAPLPEDFLCAAFEIMMSVPRGASIERVLGAGYGARQLFDRMVSRPLSLSSRDPGVGRTHGPVGASEDSPGSAPYAVDKRGVKKPVKINTRDSMGHSAPEAKPAVDDILPDLSTAKHLPLEGFAAAYTKFRADFTAAHGYRPTVTQFAVVFNVSMNTIVRYRRVMEHKDAMAYAVEIARRFSTPSAPVRLHDFLPVLNRSQPATVELFSILRQRLDEFTSFRQMIQFAHSINLSKTGPDSGEGPDDGIDPTMYGESDDRPSDSASIADGSLPSSRAPLALLPDASLSARNEASVSSAPEVAATESLATLATSPASALDAGPGTAASDVGTSSESGSVLGNSAGTVSSSSNAGALPSGASPTLVAPPRQPAAGLSAGNSAAASVVPQRPFGGAVTPPKDKAAETAPGNAASSAGLPSPFSAPVAVGDHVTVPAKQGLHATPSGEPVERVGRSSLLLEPSAVPAPSGLTMYPSSARLEGGGQAQGLQTLHSLRNMHVGHSPSRPAQVEHGAKAPSSASKPTYVAVSYEDMYLVPRRRGRPAAKGVNLRPKPSSYPCPNGWGVAHFPWYLKLVVEPAGADHGDLGGHAMLVQQYFALRRRFLLIMADEAEQAHVPLYLIALTAYGTQLEPQMVEASFRLFSQPQNRQRFSLALLQLRSENENPFNALNQIRPIVEAVPSAIKDTDVEMRLYEDLSHEILKASLSSLKDFVSLSVDFIRLRTNQPLRDEANDVVRVAPRPFETRSDRSGVKRHAPSVSAALKNSPGPQPPRPAVTRAHESTEDISEEEDRDDAAAGVLSRVWKRFRGSNN